MPEFEQKHTYKAKTKGKPYDYMAKPLNVS